MSEAIILPQFPPDLSGYALTTHTHSLSSLGAAASSHSHSGYASSSHSHSGYATQTWVTQNFAPKGSGGGDSGTTTPGTSTGNTCTISISPKTYSISLTNNTAQQDNRWNSIVFPLTTYKVPSVISGMSISWTGLSYSVNQQTKNDSYCLGRIQLLALRQQNITFSVNNRYQTPNLITNGSNNTYCFTDLCSYTLKALNQNPRGVVNTTSQIVAGSQSLTAQHATALANQTVYFALFLDLTSSGGFTAHEMPYSMTFTPNNTMTVTIRCT